MLKKLTPEAAYKQAFQLGKRIPEIEHIISKDGTWAYLYATYVIKGRWSKAEPDILNNAEWSYLYAKDTIKDRWLEAEPIIAKDAEYAYKYALNIIKGRWEEAEPAIAKDARYSHFYSIDIIKDRWLEAEATIAQNAAWSKCYILHWFDNWFENDRVVTKNEVSDFAWLSSGAQGYFAQASLFEKISALDE